MESRSRTRGGTWLRATVAAAVFALALVGVAPTAGATTQTLGQANPGGGSTITCGSSHACTFVQKATVAGSPSYTVPAGNWVVTGWKHKSGPGSAGSARLVVFRPTGTTDQYLTVAISPSVSQSAGNLIGPNDGGVRIPVEANDIIGVDYTGDAAWYYAAPAGNTVSKFNFPDPAVSATRTAETPSESTAALVNIGATIESDADDDGFADTGDNCSSIANADQANSDADAQGDACDLDDDNDGVVDASDNCRINANADQANADADSLGDACDPDDDNDGVADISDNCRTAVNVDQANSDADAQGDACDPDDDNDTVGDGTDNCPLLANTDQANADGDAHGNACDGDDDNDGVADADDSFPIDPTRSRVLPDVVAQLAGPTAPPTLSALKLVPRSFAAAKSGASTAATKKPTVGTTVSYTTSQDSTTTFLILKSSTGIRKGTSCVKAAKGAKGKRCALLVRQKPTFTHADKAGKVTFTFTGRLGGKALRPGSYVLRATGANAKGAGKAVQAAFKIVKR